jgi:tetratricopeptide (TPR) repeat protein
MSAGVVTADSEEQDTPIIRGGTLNADAAMPDFNEDEVWDHRYLFAALGMAYEHRISKEFEVGADLSFGLSLSTYDRRVVTAEGQWYPIGELGLLAGVAGAMALNPSYNLSLRVTPTLRYARSLGKLHDFDGLYFGIGFSAAYRFGTDPDAPGREIRSIRFGKLSIPPLFAAMQSYYTRNPIATVTVTNTGDRPVRDLQILFGQTRFMDSPTPAKTIAELPPGESTEVPLLASFNSDVFTIEGTTPLTGEVIAEYTVGGRPAEQRQPVSFDLHDKTAITWDDDAKAAAFITPADSALRNYTSFIRQLCREETAPLYNEPLQFAAQAYCALEELGILYQADPARPFSEVHDDEMTVDSISLPRDTLTRITGDCDDLTVLFCSLLETVGIESGFITVPGHIYAVLNTKEKSRNYRTIHPDRSMTIGLDGELWVPVEVTMLGRGRFLEAWRKGAEQWNSYAGKPGKRGFHVTRAAQELYRPVGLRETDLGLQYGSRETIRSAFNAEMDRLIGQVVRRYADAAAESGRPQDYNRLGVAYARFGRYRQARSAFGKALSAASGYLSARVNLANVLYLQGEYEKALSAYRRALAVLDERGDGGSLRSTLLLSIARSHYQLESYGKAQEYYVQAADMAPAAAKEHAYLASAGPGGSIEDSGAKVAATGPARDGGGGADSSGRAESGRAAGGRDLRYEVTFVEEEVK